MIPFVGHSKILNNHCFQFLLGVKMASRQSASIQNFGVANEEYYVVVN